MHFASKWHLVQTLKSAALHHNKDQDDQLTKREGLSWFIVLDAPVHDTLALLLLGLRGSRPSQQEHVAEVSTCKQMGGRENLSIVLVALRKPRQEE